MKIKEHIWSGRGKQNEVSVSTAVEVAVDGRDYERGAVEAASAGVDALGRYLGLLTEILVNKGVLGAEEMRTLLQGRYEVEE